MALVAGLGPLGLVAVWLGLVLLGVGGLLALVYGGLRLLRPPGES